MERQPYQREEEHDHPLCAATMVCMRGPCQYYWTMISRLKAPGTRISKKHSQTCVSPAEETDLNEENIYSCSRWWPALLSWVPQSIRPTLRPVLVRAFESYLVVLLGYDMSWKDWEDDIFETGKKTRGNLKLGAQQE